MAAAGSGANPFADDVIRAVMRHMNNQHARDCVLICRGLGGRPEASAAEMSGMDGDGIDFVATVGDEAVAVRVPWSHRLTERAEVRVEVTRMYEQACALLGLPARSGGAH